MDAAAAAHAANEIAMQAAAAAQSSANVQIAAIITTAAVTILTLWIKTAYEGRAGRKKTDDVDKKAVIAANKASQAAVKTDTVLAELKDNTAKTEAIDGKADTIVHRTNGVMDALQSRVTEVEKNTTILTRDFLEMKVYNREATHRLLGAVDAVHKMLQEVLVVRRLKGEPDQEDKP